MLFSYIILYFKFKTNKPHIFKRRASCKENVNRKINELKLNQTKHNVRRWPSLGSLLVPPNGGGLNF